LHKIQDMIKRRRRRRRNSASSRLNIATEIKTER